MYVECNCHYQGVTSPSCDSNGKCDCKENIFGDKCKDCQPGFFGFPNCQGISELWPRRECWLFKDNANWFNTSNVCFINGHKITLICFENLITYFSSSL